MKTVFKCKTGEAFPIKVVAELLSKNLKEGCFKINEDGIFLSQFDNPQKTQIKLDLHSENFSLFKYDYSEEMLVGLNLNHFHKILKTTKKKDSINFSIHKDNMKKLYITTTPRENTRRTTSQINIQPMQNIEVSPPEGYGKPISILSSDFQKACKDLSGIGSADIKVTVRPFRIQICADADDILKRTVEMGERDDSDDEGSDVEDNIIYSATFTTDQFTRIDKITGLSNSLKIYPGTKNLPLMFRSNVGNLGHVSVYIKSKELSAKEEEEYDSGSDSE